MSLKKNVAAVVEAEINDARLEECYREVEVCRYRSAPVNYRDADALAGGSSAPVVKYPVECVPAAVAFLGAIIDRVVRPQADNHKSLHDVLLKHNQRTGC